MRNTVPVSAGSALKRRLATAILMSICSMATLTAQVFEWTHMGGGPGWKHGNDIAVDGGGNSLIVGEFANATVNTTNPGILFGGPNPQELTTAGTTDGFIAMYDAQGNRMWVEQVKATQNSSVTVRSIAVAPEGTFYITGEIQGTVDFGEKVVSAIPFGSSFVARYTYTSSSNPGAIVTWVETAGPAPSQSLIDGKVLINGVAVDGTGNPYVCGTRIGNVNFIGNNQMINRQSDTFKIFAAKYTTSTSPGRGDVEWVTECNGTGDAHCADIAVTGNGETVVTGHFTGDVDFGTTQTQISGSSLSNLVIAWFDTDGSPLSVMKAVGNGGTRDSIQGRGIAVDASGNAYVIGKFAGTVNFNLPNGSISLTAVGGDYFIVKYGGSGQSWVVQGNTDITSDAIGNGIAVHRATTSGSQDSIFVTGTFAGRMSIGAATLRSLGNHDVFVGCYNGANASVHWVQRAGNTYTLPPQSSRNHYDQGIGIAVDRGRHAHIVGEFGGDGVFDDALFFANRLSSNHVRNVFVARLSAEATTVTGTVTMAGVPIENHVVTVSDEATNPTVFDHVTTDATGNYITYLPSQGMYRIQTESRYRALSNPLPPGYYSVTATGGTLAQMNFNFVANGPDTTDLRITMTVQSTEYAAPGSTVSYRIIYENIGTMPVANGMIGIKYDQELSDLAYTSSTASVPSFTAFAPDTGTWQLMSPLQPMDRGEILVSFTVRSAEDGEISWPPLKLSATITQGGPPDANQLDNSSSVLHEVFFPSDPNEKTSSPSGNIPATAIAQGTDLTYTIPFYNIGPTDARIVTIEDTLDPAFFGSNPIITNVSGYPFDPDPTLTTVTLSSGATAKVARFQFDGINLRPITESVAGSHGVLRFSVRVNPNLPVGTMITNRAAIKFDTQHWIYTNVAENCIVPDFSFDSIAAGRKAQFRLRASDLAHLRKERDEIIECSWDFGDRTPSSREANPRHLYMRAGKYKIRLTIRFRLPVMICGKFYSVYTVEKLVNVHAIPKPAITSNGIILTSSEAASYQWYFNGVKIPGATDRTFTPTKSGRYMVRVRNEGGFEGTSNAVSFVAKKPKRRY